MITLNIKPKYVKISAQTTTWASSFKAFKQHIIKYKCKYNLSCKSPSRHINKSDDNVSAQSFLFL